MMASLCLLTTPDMRPWSRAAGLWSRRMRRAGARSHPDHQRSFEGVARPQLRGAYLAEPELLAAHPVFRSVGQILSPRCLGARRRIANFAGRSHEHRLKKNRGGHGTEERKGHHGHARCARISREPKAPKGCRCRCRQHSEFHGAPQGSTAAGSFCRIATPRCNRS